MSAFCLEVTQVRRQALDAVAGRFEPLLVDETVIAVVGALFHAWAPTSGMAARPSMASDTDTASPTSGRFWTPQWMSSCDWKSEVLNGHTESPALDSATTANNARAADHLYRPQPRDRTS